MAMARALRSGRVRRPSAEGVPLAVSIALATLMVWLARGPFDAPAARVEAVPLSALELIAPSGTLATFPRSFSWSESPNVDVYEITVANAEERRTLFRQRGNVPGLQLTIDAGSEPPPGEYVWEVLAFRRGVPCARGVGRFVVRPPAGSP